MRIFTDEQLSNIDFSTAEAALSNNVYEASRLIEQLEYAGKVRGNGHHARQAIAAAATEELKSRWITDEKA